MTQTLLLLERLAALIQQLVREDAASHGLLPVHLQVLSFLAQANRYSDMPIAVADYLRITRGTVSQTLSPLERRGLIRKEADPRHGKWIHLSLTAAGEAVLTTSWMHRLEQALAASSADTQAFRDDLAGVLSCLQALNDHRAFGQCRQCAHFLKEDTAYRCGLTGDVLASEQTARICREWIGEKPPAAIPGGSE